MSQEQFKQVEWREPLEAHRDMKDVEGQEHREGVEDERERPLQGTRGEYNPKRCSHHVAIEQRGAGPGKGGKEKREDERVQVGEHEPEGCPAPLAWAVPPAARTRGSIDADPTSDVEGEKGYDREL